MASENKKAKTNKRNHWGRGANFLKGTTKLKGLCFYNPSDRQRNKQEVVKQAGICREELPENCVGREYNMFNT